MRLSNAGHALDIGIVHQKARCMAPTLQARASGPRRLEGAANDSRLDFSAGKSVGADTVNLDFESCVGAPTLCEAVRLFRCWLGVADMPKSNIIAEGIGAALFWLLRREVVALLESGLGQFTDSSSSRWCSSTPNASYPLQRLDSRAVDLLFGSGDPSSKSMRKAAVASAVTAAPRWRRRSAAAGDPTGSFKDNEDAV